MFNAGSKQIGWREREGGKEKTIAQNVWVDYATQELKTLPYFRCRLFIRYLKVTDSGIETNRTIALGMGESFHAPPYSAVHSFFVTKVAFRGS